MTRAHTSRLSASVAVARLGRAAAADLADNQGRLSLLPEETRWWRLTSRVRCAMPDPHTLSRISDGDTPVIDQPVRMVSVDTPEKAEYAGLPSTA